MSKTATASDLPRGEQATGASWSINRRLVELRIAQTMERSEIYIPTCTIEKMQLVVQPSFLVVALRAAPV